MKQRKMKQFVFVSLISAFALSSCADKDVYQGEQKNEPLKPTEVFDFNLMQQVKVNVDYGFANDYYVIFDLYSQNPMKEENDSWVKDESLSPVYSASTDKKGKYSDIIQIPSELTEVWLYSDYLGTVSPVKIDVSANGEISYNQAEYIALLQTKTRGTTSNGYNYLDDWTLLPGVDWNQYGTPSNLEAGLSIPPATTLYSIKSTYTGVSGKKITDLHPEWLNDNTTSEIKVIKETELSLVFINSSASWNNTVGYFTYPTGTIPTVGTVKKILAFPNASPITKTVKNQPGVRVGELLCGHEVKLKYWDETKQQFEDKFPAGVSVGWCLQGMGFRDGNIVKGMGTRYSYSSMNSDNAQRVVALRDGGTDQIVAIGFEDNTDYDYCDATFYLKVAETGAINPGGPELPPVNPPSDVTVTYQGTLAYEDMWPSLGDYDMNDVVVEYQSTVYKNVLTNKVYKVVDEFTPVNNGATYKCGFGYQLHNLSSDRIRKITVEGPDGWSVEEGQSYPTILLFDDIAKAIGDKYKFTVTIDLADVDQKDVMPPYNPFIFIDDRSKEVHLVNYPPTNKADMGLFNTQDDVSNVAEGIYYVAPYDGEVKLMPFGINIPVVGFKNSPERVKIYDTYPNFIGWVTSGGKKNTNWYKK